MKLKALAGMMVVAGLVAPGAALATNGYFSHGYGMKAKGMAGVSTAMTQDAFGGANNPATMVWAGSRFDVGVDWFGPKRSMQRTDSSAFTSINDSAVSGSNSFYVPEFGYNRMLNQNLSLGVSVYGNGGMNTDYAGGGIGAASLCAGFNPLGAGGAPFNALCGSGKLGVDLMQLIIAPTLSYKLNERHSIGVSPLFGYQRFKAEGLQAFTGFSTDANSLTNRGYDDSTGWGVRVGWLGKLSDSVSIGAAYSSRMRMGKFDKYKGLFAEEGDFDLPENWNVGISFKPAKGWTVGVDYQQINYGKVRSVANPSTNGGMTAANTLGNADGRGFGWDDIGVFKVGVEYQASDRLALRAGYSASNNPISARDVTFNIIAPGVIRDHLTLGGTYALDKDSEITVAYMHAFKNSVSGDSLFSTWSVPMGAGTSGVDRIEMHQNSLGIAYGRKF